VQRQGRDYQVGFAALRPHSLACGSTQPHPTAEPDPFHPECRTRHASRPRRDSQCVAPYDRATET
jgi:hypothetical protein